MKRRYAIARVNWLLEEQGGIRQPLAGHVLKPAAFQADASGSWWTLALVIDRPVHAGETVEIPIALIVEEAAPRLLRKGRVFELKEGPRTIAIGEVVKVGTFEARDGETPEDALRRAAGSGTGGRSRPEATVT